MKNPLERQFEIFGFVSKEINKTFHPTPEEKDDQDYADECEMEKTLHFEGTRGIKR